ncbi:MAG: hypothetical protein Greene071436_139 [Parcubacteria group bacterium Greene0714_36]|nr:MAG: hypothetical protein Greene071436_139 [Parcubacteria group bacterium Greene0714_36]
MFFWMSWLLGALGMFILGLGVLAHWDFAMHADTSHFLLALAICIAGSMGMYLRLRNPAEQLSWTEAELRAMRHITYECFGLYSVMFIAALALLPVKIVALVLFPSVGVVALPFSVIGWMVLSSTLLTVISYLLDIGRLDNLGQMLGWDRNAPK